MAPRTLVLLTAAAAAYASPSSFGFAGKGMPISTTESTVYKYDVPASASFGTLVFMNIQSDELLWANFDFARFRIYIDGEATPSVDFPFGFFCEGDIVPWGQSVIGNTADSGGIYITLKIPFSKSIVVNATLSPSDFGPQAINVALRGTVDVPYQFGSVTATDWPTARLRTASIDAVAYQPYETVWLLNSSSAGSLAMIGFKAYGQGNMTYLSGLFKGTFDANPPFPLGFDTPAFLIADDTLSAGKFTTAISGLTALDQLLTNSLIGWRTFQEDPIVWSTSAALSWQIGTPGLGQPSITTVYSSLWYYEMPAAA